MIQFVLYTTLLYAVNARVTVNIFEDGEISNVELKNCQPLDCDRNCRNIGFVGGACVDGRCKCDIAFAELKQDVFEENSYNPEVRRCQPLDCDRNCRNIGFPGGACVNGRCKCDIRLSASNMEEPKQGIFDENVYTPEVRRCQPLDCDRNCRNIGFPGGACVNGKCKCDIRLSASNLEEVKQDEVFEEDAYVPVVRRCQPLDCDRNCRNIGFPGGACVNGKCKCDIRMSASNLEEPKQDVFEENAYNPEVRRCQPLDCDRNCRNIGFPGGACVNGKCKCDIRISASNLEDAVKSDIRSCQPLDCDRNCRNIGFPGGACVNGKCKCDIRLSASSYEEPIQDVFDENVYSSEVRRCQPLDCNRNCRNIGFPGGACVNGKCKCDIRLSEIMTNEIPKENILIPEPEAIAV